MIDELPSEFAAQMADLVSHRIEGIAVMGDTPFSCPLVSHVEGNLWQGGTPADGGGLPAYFDYVLNLYPWVGYPILRTGLPGTVIRTAHWVNEKRALGPTLVHCQAGLNRSALVVALALMRDRTAEEAIALLREKRSPAVLCNRAFEDWLRNDWVRR